jgi:hypothetical protein
MSRGKRFESARRLFVFLSICRKNASTSQPRRFPNRGACLRLVSALAIEQSEEWPTGSRYLDMRELEEHRREEKREAEEVALMER